MTNPKRLTADWLGHHVKSGKDQAPFGGYIVVSGAGGFQQLDADEVTQGQNMVVFGHVAMKPVGSKQV